MTAGPPPTPVTGTLMVLAFAWMVTVCGTNATAGLLELTLITKLVGAGAESVRNNCWRAVPIIVKLDGEKVSVSVDETTWLTVENPGAEAVIVAEPNAMPFSLGGDVGAIAPAG